MALVEARFLGSLATPRRRSPIFRTPPACSCSGSCTKCWGPRRARPGRGRGRRSEARWMANCLKAKLLATPWPRRRGLPMGLAPHRGGGQWVTPLTSVAAPLERRAFLSNEASKAAPPCPRPVPRQTGRGAGGRSRRYQDTNPQCYPRCKLSGWCSCRHQRGRGTLATRRAEHLRRRRLGRCRHAFRCRERPAKCPRQRQVPWAVDLCMCGYSSAMRYGRAPSPQRSAVALVRAWG
mmetsp:Transcript_49785/g.139335  ORF Transcript_49785/g.139335 Transcript_49785/m.139335 type:complete len:236 (-) Transcript_49785:156-863(-)